MKKFSFIRSMPFLLLAMSLLAVGANSCLNIPCKACLYAFSLSLKEIIIFLLPFLIFSLLFKTALSLAKNASKLILTLLVAVCASNTLSTLLSYGFGLATYNLDLAMGAPVETLPLVPAWDLKLPKIIGNDVAMFLGLVLGVLIGRFRPKYVEMLTPRLELFVNILLKGFLCLIPLFIAGFVVKMAHEEVMDLVLRNYGIVFAIVIGAVFSYIALLYLIAAQFRVGLFAKSIKRMFPAAIVGFGSMSSAAAMPLTIYATEENAQEPSKSGKLAAKGLAQAIIPATVNIHLIGDCFAIPIFAFAVLKNFSVAEPDMVAYLIFVAYFVMAKFSVAAVPGGGILVMLPILESALHFNVEMLSLITALYILFDPVITVANILGNGGFAILLSKWVSPSVEGAPQ